MKMKQFAQKITYLLQQVKEVPSDDFSKSESSLILSKRLKKLIEQFSHSDEDVTSNSVQPLCDMIAEHFNLIHNSNLTYFLNMGPDNEKCWLIAKLLAPIVEKHFLLILIPTLKMDNKYLPELYFNEAKTRDFFISEKGDSLIRRSAVLHYASIKKGLLASTYEPNKRELTSIEKNLVINYNQQSRAYFDKITCQENLKKVKKDYSETLIGAQQQVALKEYGYGEEGEKRLQFRILQQSDSFSSFAKNMLCYVNKAHWKFIIKNFDIKILTKLLLGIEKVPVDVLEKKLEDIVFTDHANTNRLIGLCALNIYWKESRSQQGEFKSFIGSIFGRWVAYNKEDKKEAVKLGMEFLLSDLPLTMQSLEEFLKEKNKEQIKGALLEKGSVLGNIFKKLLGAANINFIVTPSNFNFTNLSTQVSGEALMSESRMQNKLT